jgi:hypothetical protein
MKNIILILGFIFLIACNNLNNTKSELKKNKIIKDTINTIKIMEIDSNIIALQKYYTEYSKIPIEDYVFKIDSFQKEVFTKKFYEITHNNNQLDNDYFTNNLLLEDEFLSTLEITKKNNDGNIYIVSFMADISDIPNKRKMVKNIFEVNVIYEDKKIKIDKTCCF